MLSSHVRNHLKYARLPFLSYDDHIILEFPLCGYMRKIELKWEIRPICILELGVFGISSPGC